MASELQVGRIGVGIAPAHAATIYGTGAGNATVQIEGEGGADPTINLLTNNTTHWALGVDDSDSDNFKICKHSAIASTNNYLTITSAGQVEVASGNAHISSATQGSLNFGNISTNIYAKVEYDDTNGNFNINNTRAYPLRFLTNDTERMSITSAGVVQFGLDGVQGGAFVSIRRNGDSINFGHSNGAGYGSVIGCSVNNGNPHLGFMCEAGTTDNTFKTRGLKGTVLYTNTSGELKISQITNANADNQAPTDRITIDSSGNLNQAGGKFVLQDGSGANVGEISTISTNNLTISGVQANHSGLSFATQAILPATQSATNDNTVDLGADGNSFKDLYLAGLTMNGSGGTASIRGENIITLANDATTTFEGASALIAVYDTAGQGALFYSDYAGSALTKLGGDAHFNNSTSSGTVRIFSAANDATVTIRNYAGSNRTIKIVTLGM